ncbi:NACHT domain-containing protein [Natrinema salaciae]|uniref:HEAT repeat-containing protein n=1 Tax=Natrinema salaciae TaxID=1186196 RepID=A0A1H9SB71_9EURY|nr:hypothetical protein [Natrinema salaciae]SER81429.1 hypothetical protein SAMN04489841_4632 [Natrinema salaciae]
MSDLPHPAPARALERFADRIVDRGATRGADPEATVRSACERRPGIVRDQFSVLADALREEPPATADVDREAAARMCYAVLDSVGEPCFEVVTEAAWDAVDAAVDARGAPGAVGTYARATSRAVPFPNEYVPSDGPVTPDDVRDRLEDPEWRRTAAYLCARHHHVPEGCAETLAACLDADPAGRWAAAAFDWDDSRPDAVADRLLAATERDEASVRAGAIGALCHRLWLRDDVPDWADEAMDALADALTDDADVVRLRAGGVLDCYPSYLYESDLWDGLDPGVRGRLALGKIRLGPDATASDDGSPSGRGIVGVLDPPDVWAVRDELFDAGWKSADDSSMLARSAMVARSAIADAADADPDGIDDPVRYVDAIRARAGPDGVGEHEARLLRVLFESGCDAVVDAVPELESTLDTESPEDDSREAARALGVIRNADRDAVPVGRETLVAAVGEPIVRGYLKPERLAALATIDPDAATPTLHAACDDVDEYGRDVGKAIETVAEADPTVVAAVGDAATAAVGELDERDRARPLRGLAIVADHDPDALAPDTDAFVDHLESIYPEARTAAAHVLRRVGQARPSAVPAAVDALVETDPDAPGWPLTPISRDSPKLGRRAVSNATSTLENRWSPESSLCCKTIAEVATGAPDLGREGATALVADPSDETARDETDIGAFLGLADHQPAIAAEATGDLLRWLDEEPPTERARDSLEEILEPVAEAAPDRVRDAILAQYDTPDAFVDAAPSDPEHRARRRRVASSVGLEPSDPVAADPTAMDESPSAETNDGFLRRLLDSIGGSNDADNR